MQCPRGPAPSCSPSAPRARRRKHDRRERGGVRSKVICVVWVRRKQEVAIDLTAAREADWLIHVDPEENAACTTHFINDPEQRD